MSPEEAARAAALHASALSDAVAGRPWPAREILGFLGAPGSFAFTSPEAGRPQALLLGRVAGPEAELATIAVHPQARRAGLARGLLAAFATRARADGAEEAFLEVAESNAPARALYAAQGWREVGRRRGYYRAADGSAVDALVLTLRLPK